MTQSKTVLKINKAKKKCLKKIYKSDKKKLLLKLKQKMKI